MPDYPYFQSTPVGLSPRNMKMFLPEDLKALCEAFRQLTGMDPLGESHVSTLWKNHLIKTGRSVS